MPDSAHGRGGYRSVTPRMFVDDVEGAVGFLRAVFDARGEWEPSRPAELHIGDSIVMMSSAAERGPFAAFLYIYVDDVDEVFGRAVDAGATVLEEPSRHDHSKPRRRHSFLARTGQRRRRAARVCLRGAPAPHR